MAKRKRKAAKRKSRPMRPGECRTTSTGMEYCMLAEGVRFTGQVGGVSGGLGRAKSRRRASTKGKTCLRFKRVPQKGTTGTVRRCAKFG